MVILSIPARIESKKMNMPMPTVSTREVMSVRFPCLRTFLKAMEANTRVISSSSRPS